LQFSSQDFKDTKKKIIEDEEVDEEAIKQMF